MIGSLKTRKWTDDKNQNHYITEVIVNFGDEVVVSPVEKTEQPQQND